MGARPTFRHGMFRGSHPATLSDRMFIPSQEILAKVEVLADLEPVVDELMDRARGQAHPLVPERTARPGTGHRSRRAREAAAGARPRASACRPASRWRSTRSPRKGCRTSTACSRVPRRRHLLGEVEQPVDGRGGPARRGAARLRARQPHPRQSGARAHAVRVPQGRLRAGVGQGPVSRVRVHHAAGAGHAGEPRQHRQARRGVRATDRRSAANVAKEEARHYVFYREIFKRVLERDPNRA
jgi:hypothetical protein